MSPNVTQTLTLARRKILVSVVMLVFGAYLLIAGKIRLSKYSVKGVPVRIIGAVILLGSAIYLPFTSSAVFSINMALIIQLVAPAGRSAPALDPGEKPATAVPLPPETHTYPVRAGRTCLPSAPAAVEGWLGHPDCQRRHRPAPECHRRRVCLSHDEGHPAGGSRQTDCRRATTSAAPKRRRITWISATASRP